MPEDEDLTQEEQERLNKHARIRDLLEIRKHHYEQIGVINDELAQLHHELGHS